MVTAPIHTAKKKNSIACSSRNAAMKREREQSYKWVSWRIGERLYSCYLETESQRLWHNGQGFIQNTEKEISPPSYVPQSITSIYMYCKTSKTNAPSTSNPIETLNQTSLSTYLVSKDPAFCNDDYNKVTECHSPQPGSLTHCFHANWGLRWKMIHW